MTEGAPSRSGYKCRFPIEVVERILGILATEVLNGADREDTDMSSADDLDLDDRSSVSNLDSFGTNDTYSVGPSMRALSAMQETSSAIYVIATPFLYRCLRLSNSAMITLLDNFGDTYEIQNVISKDPDEDAHPIDYHLYHRLRWALSSVKEIHLTLLPNRDMSDDCLEPYTEICTALKVFGRPCLWPKLDRVSVKVRDFHGRKTADLDSYISFPYRSAVMRAIGPTLHPTYLDVELPDPPPTRHFESDSISQVSSLRDMCAGHVTVSNMSDHTQGVPNARLSFTLGYSASFGKLTQSLWPHPLALSQRRFGLEFTLPHVPRLTLIGFERGLEGLSAHDIHTALEQALDSYRGCDDESLYRVRPWDSPEQGGWDVWHSYDDPFGEHFFRSDIGGADDDGHDDSGSEAAEMDDVDYAEATYDVIQSDVKRDISAICAKASSTGRQIDSMAQRMSTIVKTIGNGTDSMTEMKGNQVKMMKDIAAMMDTIKGIASKGNKRKKRSRIRRYQGKRSVKTAESKEEGEEVGWLDE